MSSQVDIGIQGKEQVTAERLKANTGVEPQHGPQQESASQHLEYLCINTIRTLAMDAVQKANSGHPGTPMALAPLAFVLWDRYLKFNPRNPHWPGRDRFILSNGHASMLLYAMLYLTGFDLPLDELKQFRQWGSKTPGHPEYGLTPGVETTTGPLGQGCGNSVGMAIAQKWLTSRFDKDLFDYRIYTFCGDGDLMEGVSNEAASVAGHLGLNNLIWFYDNNHITIEGSTSLAFSDDVATRFEGWHWNVLHINDVNNLSLIDAHDTRRSAGTRAANAGHRRHPHRVGRPESSGHEGGTWRGLGRRRSAADQDSLWLAAGCAVPGSRRSKGVHGESG